MKVIFTGNKRILLSKPVWICVAVVFVAVAAVALLLPGKTNDAVVSGTEAPAINDVQTDNDAMAVAAVLSTLENYGARDMDEAISIWAEGVAAKNCVTQYSVMSADLKERYYDLLSGKGEGMLLPTSATQIDSWYCDEVIDNDDGTSLAKLRFTMGETTAAAELKLSEEGEYCVVSSVAVEQPLYEFTGIG